MPGPFEFAKQIDFGLLCQAWRVLPVKVRLPN